MPRLDKPVHADLKCVQCNYELRGLPRDGDCPECGAPIEASVLAPAMRQTLLKSNLLVGRPLGLAIGCAGVGLTLLAVIVFLKYGR